MKLLNSLWKVGVNTWTWGSDIISVPGSASLRFHTGSCFRNMKLVCVCVCVCVCVLARLTTHVNLPGQRVLEQAELSQMPLAVAGTPRAPTRTVLSASQEESAWESGFVHMPRGVLWRFLRSGHCPGQPWN